MNKKMTLVRAGRVIGEFVPNTETPTPRYTFKQMLHSNSWNLWRIVNRRIDKLSYGRCMERKGNGNRRMREVRFM